MALNINRLIFVRAGKAGFAKIWRALFLFIKFKYAFNCGQRLYENGLAAGQ